MYLKVGYIIRYKNDNNNNNKYSKSTCNGFCSYFSRFSVFKIKLVRVIIYTLTLTGVEHTTMNYCLKKVIKLSFKRLKLSYFCVKINFV